MKSLTRNIGTGALLLLCLLAQQANANQNPPADGSGWSGWSIAKPLVLHSKTNNSGIKQLTQSSATLIPNSTLLQALVAPQQIRAQIGTPIDLGLGQTPAPNDLISETARGLDYNWAQCYLFVRNMIKFTPYHGFTRGPERTLLDREGSDGDQAFLLLALLRASGYTNNATVIYAPPPTDYYTGGVVMPLGGTESGYDTAAWIGVPGTGSVDTVYNSTATILANAQISVYCIDGGSPAASTIRLEHFWVQLTTNGSTLNLDPSFKPRQIIPVSATLASDMGYSRSNLIAQAGGTHTNDWFVRGLNSGLLAAELKRLSMNLIAKWQAAGTNVAASYWIGGDEIVQQDLTADSQTFHATSSGVVVDFLAQANAYRNALRTSVNVQHGSINTNFWLDEVAVHHLWISYSNKTGSAFPPAVLHLDDSVLVTESTGSTQSAVTAVITVTNTACGNFPASYSLVRSNAYVYAIPFGFGGDHRDGMRARAESELGRWRATGVGETNLFLRSRMVQEVGQEWLAQKALVNKLDSRLKGSAQNFFYDIGISGQADSPYVDMKQGFSYSVFDPSKFDGYMLFSSALEHAVLDEVNGTNTPAVSTVRVLDLANSSNMPIYFATSANWSIIRAALTNYTNLTGFDTDISNGRKLLLPQNGKVSLHRWSGSGYIDYGPAGGGSYSIGMMIGGGLNGGFSSEPGSTPTTGGYNEYENSVLGDSSVSTPQALDPVDMLSGASLLTRTDLALGGPRPISWTRQYDSRSRWADGPLGRGWTHSYDAHAIVHADPDSAFGRGSPSASAPSVVASYVVADLLAAGETAQDMTVAALVAKWWADQLVDGSVAVKTGNESLSFERCPDGSYVAAPGITATLSRDGTGQFTLQERLGRTYLFASNGVLSRVTDSSGNTTALTYTNGTCLTVVSNSFGSKISVNWSGSRVGSISDSANRSVSYRYSPSGCLTGVTDAAGFPWSMTFDTNNLFISESDPTGIVTVRDAYNSLAQVTNQTSASGIPWPFAFGAGWRTWESDPFSNRVIYTYNDGGRMVQRINRDNTADNLLFDGIGNCLANIDTLGRWTVRTYDSGNNLSSLVEAANTANARTNLFGYDSQSHLIAITNPLLRVTHMTYDASHRLTSQTGPDGTIVTNVFDTRGLMLSSTIKDVNGNTLSATSYGYNSAGLVTNVSATDAGNITYGYDKVGNVTNVVDALGHSTQMFYDPRGLLTNSMDALKHRTSWTYTPAGRLATIVNRLNKTNSTYWTASGKLAASRFADGGMATNVFDAADRQVAATDTRGTLIQNAVDSMGRVTNQWTSAWSVQKWFNQIGAVTTSVNAVGGRTDIAYDNLSRPYATIDPLNRVWQSTPNALNVATSSTDARGRTTTYALDILGRRVGVTYPSGRTEGFGVDPLGRITAFTNSEGHVYRIAYDGQSRLIAATNAALEQVFRNYFDPCGNLTNRIDAAGRHIVRQYDLLNHCTNTLYADGSVESFTFDAIGNLQTAQNNITTNNFGYDSMNRLTSAVSRVGGVAFTNLYRVDVGGLVTNMVYPGGKIVRLAYNADGMLTNVVDWSNRSYRITRDAAGRMNTLSYPNGITGTWGYNAGSALTNWCYSGNTNIPGRIITRDAMGLKIREDITSGPMPHPSTVRHAVNTFDLADRLTAATVGAGTNPAHEAYNYDACGGLTNAISQVSGVITPLGSYTYDLAGRLISASRTNASLVASYDAIGNRIRTTINGTNHLWVIDHSDSLKRPLMETDTNGAPIHYYIWGAGQLLAVIDADGTTRFGHSDDQGNIVALTDSNGNTLFTAAYGPYGEPWGSSGTNVTPFGWLGSHGVFHLDGSSLYLTRHRAYDITMKRFLSADPMGLGGGSNLYGYGNGNPLAYIDPLGLDGLWFDNLASWSRNRVTSTENQLNTSLPWGVAGTINTFMEIGNNILSAPAAIGHLGEGSGRFAGDPSWENAPGLCSDISIVASTLAAGMAPLPSANVPLGYDNVVYRYVGAGEANSASGAGTIPNTYADGLTARPTYVTPDPPMSSVAQAEDSLQIGQNNPVSPSESPTHILAGDAADTTFDYQGPVAGGSGTEMTTNEEIPLISSRPIGYNLEQGPLVGAVGTAGAAQQQTPSRK